MGTAGCVDILSKFSFLNSGILINRFVVVIIKQDIKNLFLKTYVNPPCGYLPKGYFNGYSTRRAIRSSLDFLHSFKNRECHSVSVAPRFALSVSVRTQGLSEGHEQPQKLISPDNSTF